jgi:hypothetical protein
MADVYVLVGNRGTSRHIAVTGEVRPLCGTPSFLPFRLEPAEKSPEIPWCKRCTALSEDIFQATRPLKVRLSEEQRKGVLNG